MNIVIFLYYLGCTILIIMLGKFLNQPVPETHWLILFLGVILGIVFKVPRRQAFLYGFICGFSVALVYILSTSRLSFRFSRLYGSLAEENFVSISEVHAN